jgi:acid phosphatase (class A)
MNMNMNMGFAGVAEPTGAPTRIRFNTADYRKLIPTPIPPLEPPVLPQFPQNWDADLRSYIYLDAFILGNPGWFPAMVAAAGPPPAAGGYQNQLVQILNMSPDRDDRFLEIIHQHDAEGSISYYLGMLMIDPARHPHTNLLIRAARRIGEHVTMKLKGHFMIPRPSQLCPAITPMIDPPVTPAFPAGHALQARLITLCLRAAWPGPQRQTLLDYLAHRIGENRIIAGIHYPIDITAGVAVANALFLLLNPPPPAGPPPPPTLFQQLIAQAAAEA